jgi:flavin-dependent dehydrogenase
VEAALNEPRERTEIYFDPLFRGGYGWLFPKGETANVGVAVNTRLGGRPGLALEALLDRLGLSRAGAVGLLAGAIPVGGVVSALQSGNILLAGDAAGLTHPVTGGGIAPAAISGRMAGEAAARAISGAGLEALARYPEEWDARMGAPLRQALVNRRYLDAQWSDDPAALSAIIRETWIAFPAYGRPKTSTKAARG